MEIYQWRSVPKQELGNEVVINRAGAAAVFGIDFPEFIVILIFALILFGPEKLPEYSQKLGQMVYKWKRAYTNLQRTMYMPPDLTQPSSLTSHYQDDLCPKCRQRVSGDFVFCPACGQRLKEAPSGEQAPPAV
jgi:sec-independent protein translocase protein TatA